MIPTVNLPCDVRSWIHLPLVRFPRHARFFLALGAHFSLHFFALALLGTSSLRRQEEAYNRLMELNGSVVDDRWITVADA